MAWTIAWNDGPEADVGCINPMSVCSLLTYKSHASKPHRAETINYSYRPCMKTYLPWTQHIWMHLSQLRSQVKWSSLLTCSRYWTAKAPPPHSSSFTIKDTEQIRWQQKTIKANVSHLETIRPRSQAPRPASHALFAEHQLHMLALLCLKWTNAKTPLYSSGLGLNVC